MVVITDTVIDMDESDKNAARGRRTVESCPVCQGRNFVFERTIRDHATPAVYKVNHCPDCTLRFIADPPEPSVLAAAYENPAGLRMHSSGSPLHERLRRSLVKSEMKPLTRRLQPDSKIIDFGTGDGFVAQTLHDLGYSVSAIDRYPQTGWSRPGIEYSSMDLNNPVLPPMVPPIAGAPKTPTLAVVIRHVLEHLYDPASILKQLNDADAKYVVIIVPNYRSMLRPLLGEYWYYWDPPRHLMYFTKKSLYCLAERCGYKLAETNIYAIDELVTSLHRYLLLNRTAQPSPAALRLEALTDPKSPVAAVSSVMASFFGNCVIHGLLEKYPSH